MMRDFGKLHVSFALGRSLWKEEYVGPKEYAGVDPEFWQPHHHGWKVLRGTAPIMTPDWWRILLGRAYIHVRRNPFIFVWAYYNRRVDVRLRWN